MRTGPETGKPVATVPRQQERVQRRELQDQRSFLSSLDQREMSESSPSTASSTSSSSDSSSDDVGTIARHLLAYKAIDVNMAVAGEAATEIRVERR